MPGVRPAVFAHPGFPDYSLLDSGGGEKLERFGDAVLVRPDPQAIWSRRLPPEAWRRADLAFVRESDRGGRWEAPGRGRRGGHGSGGAAPEAWAVGFDRATLLVRPTPFKHVGLFPEQASNWRWVESLAAPLSAGGTEPRLLNLFGYTGAASILAAQAGFRPTHVDASKASLAWARDNAERSGLDQRAIRFLLEDARTFVQRELRRGNRYEGILLDPPHYGRGPKGEKWQLEEHLSELIAACAGLLAERAFLCLSVYAVGLLPLSLVGLLDQLGDGQLEAGELAVPEAEHDGVAAPRLLSCGMCARWTRGFGSRA